MKNLINGLLVASFLVTQTACLSTLKKSASKSSEGGDSASSPDSSKSNEKERETRSSDKCGPIPKMILPVDIAEIDGRFWPFGVHGINGHPEGHPGFDFASSQKSKIIAPMDGIITFVEDMNGMDGYESEGLAYGLAITDRESCTSAWLYSVDLTSELRALLASQKLVGLKLKQGEQIGSLSKSKSTKYMTHWGIENQSAQSSVCPADYIDAEVYRCELGYTAGEATPANCSISPAGGTLMSRVNGKDNGFDYAESRAREQTFDCADGSKLTLKMAAETSTCNKGLEADQKAKLQSCLQMKVL